MICEAWIPPDHPSPSEILHSALDDTRSGAYSRALAKFLWYHNHALHHEPSQYGVRLSFALGYWLDLATIYPPAYDALVQTRDEAETTFRDDPSNFELFHDLASLNARLGEGVRTADLFVNVAQKDHATAQPLYHLAEDDLVSAGRYHTCGPFLDPRRRLAMAARCYRIATEHKASRPHGIPIPRVARRHYVKNIATLVALLALNDRGKEAKTAYRAALRVLDDENFRRIMDAAVTGHFPDRRV